MTRLALIPLLSGALGFATVVQAQDEAAVDVQVERERARALFDRAQVLLDEGRDEEAIPLLEESLATLPHPPTAFSLGLAHLEAGHFLAAEAVFLRLVDDEFGALPADRRGEVEARLEEAQGRVANLSIGVAGVADAEVFVDDESWGVIARGAWSHRRVDPGTRVLRATAAGAEAAELTVTLAEGGAHRHEFALEPAAGDPETGDARVAPAEEPRGVAATDDGGLSGGVWAIIIVAAVAVVAGGVAAVVVATSGSDEPAMHPVFGRPEALLSF